MKSNKRTEYIQTLVKLMKEANMKEENMVGLFYETDEAKLLDWLHMIACMKEKGRMLDESAIVEARMLVEIEV